MLNLCKLTRFFSNASRLNALQLARNLSGPHTTSQSPVNQAQPVVWTCNEWDPLEEVILGRPENAVVPTASPEVLAVFGSKRSQFFLANQGKLWSDVLPDGMWLRIQREIAEFERILEFEGVTVVRPDPPNRFQFDTDTHVEEGGAAPLHSPLQKPLRTPNFTTQCAGLYAAMPRDALFVLGNEIIEAPMAWRCRYFEHLAYRPLIRGYFARCPQMHWSAAPKCSMAADQYDEECPGIVGGDANGRGGARADGAPHQYVTREVEPMFDAADFIRCGRDVFAQRSHVTNRMGIEWLRRHLQNRAETGAQEIRVHHVEFAQPYMMHLDTNLVPLRPGLFLVHGTLTGSDGRPVFTGANEQRHRHRLAGWEFVRMPDEANKSSEYSQFMNYEGLPRNILSLDEQRVLVEASAHHMIEFLEGLGGFRVIKVKLRNAYNLGGGFHCWTCDIRRRGRMQSYFDWTDAELNLFK